jgi:DNA-binding SARP family transcriptional activator
MEYRLLGPLEVLDASGRKLPLGGAMQQSVLASLLLRAGQTVGLERLIDDLWDEPPETAARTVQAYISRLRHQLPEGMIESRPGGYAVLLNGDRLDLHTFEQTSEQGRAALANGDSERARQLLRDALALWRGPALAGLPSDALRREAERLEELHLQVLEDRLEADLERGSHREVVAELQALVAEQPFRERLRVHLMVALYRAGRQTEALDAYQDARRILVDELGIEPSAPLRELEQAILRQDTSLAPPVPATPPMVAATEPPVVPPREERRKTVTILFADLSTSETLDPELLRETMRRVIGKIRAVFESHGATIEQRAKDELMAVFGVPLSHEDDGLRACRAAIEVREALRTQGVEGRIGLTTGEVLTGTEERLVTGDAVNVASRLEQVAQPGEVLVGQPTLALIRGAAEVEPVEPLELKGKAEPVAAYRLLHMRDAPERPPERPFVGRDRELALLREPLERVLAEQRCELVTVVGEAGVGKSRLVAEALISVEATVARGRCLPYGEGITYWPVVEVLKQLDVLPTDNAAAVAIRSLLGETEAATSAEEIGWALRKTLEQAAAERPLVVVFDDIQWGEETFRDLIEYVALLSSGASVLLLCMARPELTERNPAWPVTLRLEPLPEDDVEELIGERVPEQLRERIARAAGGNPLFIEEMLAMAGEVDGTVVVPPSLQALLAARLDQLEVGERSVLERGAIEGEIFHGGAVQALSRDETQVTPRLAALVRKELIRPERQQLTGEDGFRFRHLLLRDAAYEALPKAVRAELHERLATWLEQHGAELVELDELLGYHLEQACRYHAELGQPDSALAERAGEHLATAGRRALWRVDEPAAASLLERALELTRPLRLDVHLELDLAKVFQVADAQRAAALAEAAAEQAQAAGDAAGAALARVAAAEYRMWFAADADVDELEALAGAALPLLEQAGDHAGLTRVWQALATAADNRGRLEDMARASEEALRQARLAGHPPKLTDLSMALLFGPRPADEALRALHAAQPKTDPPAEEMLPRAVLLAMLGRFDEAWPLAREANDRLSALRGSLEEGWLAEIAMLAGDLEAAARYLRRSNEFLEAHGMRNVLSGSAPQLGRVLCALGRYDEAAPLAQLGRQLAAEHDVWAQMLWRRAQALVDAASGKHAEAERLAREAVAIAERTDGLNPQGDALCDLAEILAAGGKADEAGAALQQALARYERKENIVMAERVRARLTGLRSLFVSAKRA